MPWKPGESGNPAGRQRQSLLLPARALTGKALAVIEKLMDTAEDERLRLAAAIEALDRGWGKPTQAVNVDQNVTINGGVDGPPRPDTAETAELWLERRRKELAALN